MSITKDLDVSWRRINGIHSDLKEVRQNLFRESHTSISGKTVLMSPSILPTRQLVQPTLYTYAASSERLTPKHRNVSLSVPHYNNRIRTTLTSTPIAYPYTEMRRRAKLLTSSHTENRSPGRYIGRYIGSPRTIGPAELFPTDDGTSKPLKSQLRLKSHDDKVNSVSTFQNKEQIVRSSQAATETEQESESIMPQRLEPATTQDVKISYVSDLRSERDELSKNVQHLEKQMITLTTKNKDLIQEIEDQRSDFTNKIMVLSVEKAQDKKTMAMQHQAELLRVAEETAAKANQALATQGDKEFHKTLKLQVEQIGQLNMQLQQLLSEKHRLIRSVALIDPKSLQDIESTNSTQSMPNLNALVVNCLNRLCKERDQLKTEMVDLKGKCEVLNEIIHRHPSSFKNSNLHLSMKDDENIALRNKSALRIQVFARKILQSWSLRAQTRRIALASCDTIQQLHKEIRACQHEISAFISSREMERAAYCLQRYIRDWIAKRKRILDTKLINNTIKVIRAELLERQEECLSCASKLNKGGSGYAGEASRSLLERNSINHSEIGARRTNTQSKLKSTKSIKQQGLRSARLKAALGAALKHVAVAEQNLNLEKRKNKALELEIENLKKEIQHNKKYQELLSRDYCAQISRLKEEKSNRLRGGQVHISGGLLSNLKQRRSTNVAGEGSILVKIERSLREADQVAEIIRCSQQDVI